MQKIKFTKEQEQVINHKDNNLLVFASAGSGKTAVIIEKIATDIINGYTSLDNLLVVTFTDAATAEMKQRLYDKLAENIDKPNVAQEIEKLPLANISTLHGYCQKLIKQYFFEIGIDPSFRVLDEDQSSFYKVKALDDIFRRKQEDNNQEFFSLAEVFYSTRSLNGLKENILDFYDFLQSLDDKEKYLKETALAAYNTDLENNPACQYVLNKYTYLYNSFKKDFEKLYYDSLMAGEEKLTKALEIIRGLFYKESFVNFKDCFEYYLAEGIKSPLGSLREKSDNLINARKLWEEFCKIKKDFVSLCGDVDSIDEIKHSLEDAKESIKHFICLTKEFEEAYSQTKNLLNALDFDDLEKYAMLLLENKNIAKSIKEQFKYVYVDEYQDINSKQEKILNCISNGFNTIMVGDIKQSIYGFRNSTPQIFIDKSKAYKGGKNGRLIKLNENFRSNPAILSFVNKIFDKIMLEDFGGVSYIDDGRFVGSAKYLPVDDYKEVNIHLIDIPEKSIKEKVPSEIYSVAQDDREEESYKIAKLEAITVANTIKQMKGKPYYDAKSGEFKELTFKNFNILCRSREYIREIAEELRLLNVPVFSKTSHNIYENPDILLLVNIIKLINNPKDDISLASVILSPFFGITNDEIVRLRKDSGEEYFYDFVTSIISQDCELSKKLKRVMDFLQELRCRKDYCSIYELLTFVDRELSLLNYYMLLPNGNARYEIMSDFIYSFNDSVYNYDIPQYLYFLDNYLKDCKTPRALDANEDCVNIDTMHSSKGLEYEVVFVCGCGKRFSNASLMKKVLKNKTLGVGFNLFDTESFIQKPTLAKNVISAKIKEEERLEEVRLLYVATTRAKNCLHIMGGYDCQKLRPQSNRDIRNANSYMPWIISALPAPLIDNIKNTEDSNIIDNGLDYAVHIIKPDHLVQKYEQKDLELTKVGCDQKLKKQIEEYIDKEYQYKDSFVIAQKSTVTSIMNLQNKENESYNPESKKLEINENKMVDYDYAKLGTAYHLLMQELDFDSDIQTIKNYINQKCLDMSQKPYFEKIDAGKIKACFDALLEFTKGKTIYKEKQFMAYLPYDLILKKNSPEKVLIQGVIDLLVDDGKSIDILDYKTTRVKNEDQMVEKYMMQMYLYKLAAERTVGKEVKNVYIYSFDLNKLIKII